MIVRIMREGQLYGTLHCSVAVNDWNEVDTTVWFCPHCGRIYAREEVQFEDYEQKVPLRYHVFERPCTLPLHDLTRVHPTLWNCADALMMETAIKEHRHVRDPNECPAYSAAA